MTQDEFIAVVSRRPDTCPRVRAKRSGIVWFMDPTVPMPDGWVYLKRQAWGDGHVDGTSPDRHARARIANLELLGEEA